MARSAIILTFHLKIIASRNDHGDSVHIPLLFISEKYKNAVAVVAKLSQESRVPTKSIERERERERIVLVSSRYTGVALSRARLAIHSRHGCYCRGGEGPATFTSVATQWQ